MVMRRARRSGRRCLVAAAGAAVVAGTVLTVAAPAADAGTMTVSPSGSFVVTMNGNGHGHGMSQYGAQGAALAGRTYQQILAFYYPGTALTTVSASTLIRVRLGGTGTTTTIAAYSHTRVTGVAGDLPTSGISRYRLIADAHTGLTLQKYGTATKSAWVTVTSNLPNRAEFHRTNWYSMRLFASDGSSTYYYGYLRAVRAAATGTAGGVTTVNRVSFDRYTQGVVPREMPASWGRSATDAQAVAARTYGAYAVAHPSSPDYDICDTSQCQVYGGHARYDSSARLQWSDFSRAATDTSNRVLTYKGALVFAQFAASNGGWSVSGGQPYLVAKSDPYDTAKSGDPYLGYAKTVKVATVARYFGLAKVTKIVFSTRDGHGAWDGRVLTGSVSGTDSGGHAKTVKGSGQDFANAFGVGTTWFYLKSA